MSKIQKETSLREKYLSDKIMSALLECDHNIKCINYSLECNGSSDLTLEEIGLVLGVTRERVRQLQIKALKSLRKSSFRHKLK